MIMEELLELRNYNALMMILSGLNHTSCQRLRNTWAHISPDLGSYATHVAAKRKRALDKIMKTDNNFRGYRRRVSRHVRHNEVLLTSLTGHHPLHGCTLAGYDFYQPGRRSLLG